MRSKIANYAVPHLLKKANCAAECGDENVPSPGRKRPRFRATSTKMSYIPSKACQAQGRKRPRFGSTRTKTSQIPIGKGRKRPKFHLARRNQNVPILETKRSHFETMMQQQIFWFLCNQVRFLGKYANAKICGENKNMRGYAENIELCGIVRRTGNCAKSHSPHLNVASGATVHMISRAETRHVVVSRDYFHTCWVL